MGIIAGDWGLVLHDVDRAGLVAIGRGGAESCTTQAPWCDEVGVICGVRVWEEVVVIESGIRGRLGGGEVVRR